MSFAIIVRFLIVQVIMVESKILYTIEGILFYFVEL